MNDNRTIYDENWEHWVDMKAYGPASRWLRHLIALQLQALHVDRIAKVLDIGCGEGSTTHFLAKRLPNASVRGVDFSQTGIRCAQEHFRSRNLEYKYDPEGREPETRHDLITAFEVLEHVEDWHTFLDKLAAHADRYLMLSFPTGRMRPFEVNVGHVRNYRKGEVETYLRKCGFRPLQVFYAGFPCFSPFYRELCNLTNAASGSFTRGRYGWKQKAISAVLYTAFRFGSTTQTLGDQFCGLFEKDTCACVESAAR